ncbi:MAG: GtrA family protein [Alphaproteobacteria bacterium]|nr:GtrA family protein [Alphaproteobacteria bacterium]
MLKLYKFIEDIWFKLPQKLRFLLVGGFNTVFAYLLFVFLVVVLQISYKAALIINYIIAVNVSIFTMRYYVFRSFGNLMKEYTKAWGVYITTLLLNYVAMYIMVDMCKINELVGQAVYTVLITFFTYFMHKYVSFAKPKDYPAK